MQLDRLEGKPDGRVAWGSDIAAQMLRRFGIRYISLNPGASYRGFHDSLVNHLGNENPGIILCLHEDHSVAIAHGYAKATGEPMACVLHANVGLLHGMMGLFNAWCYRAPMFVLGATGPVAAEKRRPWIDWIHTSRDQGAYIRSIIKWDDQPTSPDALVESMTRANLLTRSAPTAPVYICLDAGFQEQKLDREPEWRRLMLRDRVRPDFHVYTGNDLAIDMVMYGSDYLLGLSTFAPDLFARRDALWAAGDAAFYELNDVLQYLGFFAFRRPVPAYKHTAAMFLRLRGWTATDRTHPDSPKRTASDVEVLRDIGRQLGVAMKE